jgi:hypothetical protein
MTDIESELKKLNEFHEQIATHDPATQASMLRNGFLPDSMEALVEAGIRCIPLIESGRVEIEEGATDRLEAIIFKLKLVPDASSVRKVLERFDALTQERKKKATSDMKYGFAAMLGLTVIIGALAAYIVYLFIH